VTARSVLTIGTRQASRGEAANDEVVSITHLQRTAPSAPSPHPSLLPQRENGYVFTTRALIRDRKSRALLHVVPQA